MQSKKTIRNNMIWLCIGISLLLVLALFFYLWGESSSTPRESTAVGADKSFVCADTDKDIVFYRKRNDKMEIALTFDDGPHPYYTPLILDILEEYGIKATFFMIGENIKYYSQAAEAVLAAGHEIGNHTYRHKTLKPLGDNDILKEIQACEDAIFSLSEYRPKIIRPPEGSMNDLVKSVVGQLDYRIILWDLDTKDWAHTSPSDICRHVTQDIAAGDIILMHDFIGHNSPTPEALRMFIPALLERGYKFVTVSELLDG